jgi:hypothetical protein
VSEEAGTVTPSERTHATSLSEKFCAANALPETRERDAYLNRG